MIPPQTESLRAVAQMANREAIQAGESYVGTHHILIAIASGNSGVGAEVLRSLGIDAGSIRSAAAKNRNASPGEPEHGFRRALEAAIEEMHRLSHLELNEDHLLLGMLSDRDCFASLALAELVIDVEALAEWVRAYQPPAHPEVVARQRAAVARQQALQLQFHDHPRVRDLKQRIKELQIQLEQAVAVAEFQCAAAIRDNRLGLERDLRALYAELDDASSRPKF